MVKGEKGIGCVRFHPGFGGPQACQPFLIYPYICRHLLQTATVVCRAGCTILSMIDMQQFLCGLPDKSDILTLCYYIHSLFGICLA